jgi:hypothetical protein
MSIIELLVKNAKALSIRQVNKPLRYEKITRPAIAGLQQPGMAGLNGQSPGRWHMLSRKQ